MGGYRQLPVTPYQPENQDPLNSYGKILNLQNLVRMQKLLPGQLQEQQQQIQGGQLDIQAKQRDIATRDALNAAYSQAVTKDQNGNPQFDEGKLQSALQNGPAAYKTPEVMEGITKFHQSRIDLQKSAADLQQKNSDMIGGAAAAVKAAGYDPVLAHSLLDSLPHSPQIDQVRSLIDGDPQQFKAMIDSAVSASPKQQEFQNQRTIANIRANSVDKMEMAAWLQNNPKRADGTPTDASDYQQFKVDQGVKASIQKETNPQVVQTKVDTAAAEERVRQQISGMAKPVYAIDAQSNNRRVPVSQTEALANPKRYSLVTPVGEKDINDDLQLNTRLSDVAQKISEYERSFDQPLSPKDTALIAGAMGQGKLKAEMSAHGGGLFGGSSIGGKFDIPTDAINNLLQSAEENGLSQAAQQRLIAMRNAHEAMLGYKTVLSGSARGSDKQLDILNAALPSPVNSGEFAKEGFRQFKQNLTIAASRLPDFSRMGIQSPDDVVKSMSSGGLPQGAGKMIDKATALQFYKAAGNDPVKAQKLATDNGWKVQ